MEIALAVFIIVVHSLTHFLCGFTKKHGLNPDDLERSTQAPEQPADRDCTARQPPLPKRPPQRREHAGLLERCCTAQVMAEPVNSAN
ncbi:hypothetical protein, partial [Pseudomonas aeruginosa]|uniref:hypothetical protein n=1 Tax=Pseudomonas aeruginosa TaxID=287 RepID=UPI001EE77822